MKLLTQDEAKITLARINILSDLPNLTQLQAIEAIKLLDDLQFSYHKKANSGNDPNGKIRLAAKQSQQIRDEIADDWDICICCYLPMHICQCGREFDGMYNDDEIGGDDISCPTHMPSGHMPWEVLRPIKNP